MILTRCPACRTAFRVTPAQLRLRQGRVRCGNCGKAFNALETLLEEQQDQHTGEKMAVPEEPHPENADASISSTEGADSQDDTTPSLTDTRPNPLFVLEEKPGTPFSSESLLQDDFTPVTPDNSADLLIESFQRYRTPPPPDSGHESLPAETVRAPDESLRPAPASAPDDDVNDGIQPGFDQAEQAETPNEQTSTASADDADPARAPADWPELYIGTGQSGVTGLDEPPAMPALLAERQEDLEAPRGTAPLGPATMDTSKPAATLAEAPPETGEEEMEAAVPGADMATDIAQGATAIEPAAEDADFELEPVTRPRSWAWGLGIGVLGIAMLAQAALLFRQEVIQRLPQSRTVYAQLCASIGCSMALPRDASKIAIESSDLHPESGAPNFFRLRATVRNRATFEQTYPHLELTLTDSEDRPLARKVLMPDEWRPNGAPIDGFRAGGDLEVNLPFAAKDIAAVGYRLYVFYP